MMTTTTKKLLGSPHPESSVEYFATSSIDSSDFVSAHDDGESYGGNNNHEPGHGRVFEMAWKYYEPDPSGSNHNHPRMLGGGAQEETVFFMEEDGGGSGGPNSRLRLQHQQLQRDLIADDIHQPSPSPPPQEPPAAAHALNMRPSSTSSTSSTSLLPYYQFTIKDNSVTSSLSDTFSHESSHDESDIKTSEDSYMDKQDPDGDESELSRQSEDWILETPRHYSKSRFSSLSFGSQARRHTRTASRKHHTSRGRRNKRASSEGSSSCCSEDRDSIKLSGVYSRALFPEDVSSSSSRPTRRRGTTAGHLHIPHANRRTHRSSSSSNPYAPTAAGGLGSLLFSNLVSAAESLQQLLVSEPSRTTHTRTTNIRSSSSMSTSSSSSSSDLQQQQPSLEESHHHHHDKPKGTTPRTVAESVGSSPGAGAAGASSSPRSNIREFAVSALSCTNFSFPPEDLNKMKQQPLKGWKGIVHTGTARHREANHETRSRTSQRTPTTTTTTCHRVGTVGDGGTEQLHVSLAPLGFEVSLHAQDPQLQEPPQQEPTEHLHEPQHHHGQSSLAQNPLEGLEYLEQILKGGDCTPQETLVHRVFDRNPEFETADHPRERHAHPVLLDAEESEEEDDESDESDEDDDDEEEDDEQLDVEEDLEPKRGPSDDGNQDPLDRIQTQMDEFVLSRGSRDFDDTDERAKTRTNGRNSRVGKAEDPVFQIEFDGSDNVDANVDANNLFPNDLVEEEEPEAVPSRRSRRSLSPRKLRGGGSGGPGRWNSSYPGRRSLSPRKGDRWMARLWTTKTTPSSSQPSPQSQSQEPVSSSSSSPRRSSRGRKYRERFTKLRSTSLLRRPHSQKL